MEGANAVSVPSVATGVSVLSAPSAAASADRGQSRPHTKRPSPSMAERTTSTRMRMTSRLRMRVRKRAKASSLSLSPRKERAHRRAKDVQGAAALVAAGVAGAAVLVPVGEVHPKQAHASPSRDGKEQPRLRVRLFLLRHSDVEGSTR